jgi:hypothetical protein
MSKTQEKQRSRAPGTLIELDAESWLLTNHFRTIVGRAFPTWVAAADAFDIHSQQVSRYANGIEQPGNGRLMAMLEACGASFEDMIHALD